MQDLHIVPSLLDDSSCTLQQVAHKFADIVAAKCDMDCGLVILMADDPRRCPPPRQRLAIKRMQAQPFAPADGDRHQWETLAESCNQLDSLLSAGTATELELQGAWDKVMQARVPDVAQLEALMRAQPAFKHVLITKGLQLLQQHLELVAAGNGRPLAVICDYQEHTHATLHGPDDVHLHSLVEHLYAHPHELGEGDHKVRSDSRQPFILVLNCCLGLARAAEQCKHSHVSQNCVDPVQCQPHPGVISLPRCLAALQPVLQVLHYARLLDDFLQQRQWMGPYSMVVHAKDSDILMGLASVSGQLAGSKVGIMYRQNWHEEHHTR
jgi:hypothetical protein